MEDLRGEMAIEVVCEVKKMEMELRESLLEERESEK